MDNNTESAVGVAPENNPPLEEGLHELTELLGETFTNGIGTRATHFTREEYDVDGVSKRRVYRIGTNDGNLVVVDVFANGANQLVDHVYLSGKAGIFDYKPTSQNPKQIGSGRTVPPTALQDLQAELGTLNKPQTRTYALPKK